MDDQKKQKIVIAVLAVAALGAGSYYLVFRDSGVDPNRGRKEGPVVRRERATAEKVEQRRPEARAKRTREKPKFEVTKRERKKTDRKKVERRARRGSKKAKEKKKKIVPAA